LNRVNIAVNLLVFLNDKDTLFYLAHYYSLEHFIRKNGPFCANKIAVALPIPAEAPVTKTVFAIIIVIEQGIAILNPICLYPN
jgi:hypothetical protein